MDSLTQDSIRCNLCKVDNAHKYCAICSVSLCKLCIGDHISDEYEKHRVVSMQERESTWLYPRCEKHSNKRCHVLCKLCDTLICNLCIASGEHRFHDLIALENIYETKKEGIGKETGEKERGIVEKKNVSNPSDSLDEDYEKIITLISEQGKKMHKEIHGVINKMKKKITEIKQEHRAILEKDLKEIKQRDLSMVEDMLPSKELQKSSKQIQRPPKVHITLPKFCPTPINREMLYKMFGSIKPLLATRNKNRHGLFEELFNIRKLLFYLIQHLLNTGI